VVRRSLAVALWTLAGLLACFLGGLSALVGTGAGRALLARLTQDALARVFTGVVEIGDVRGSALTGLTLSQVRLFDADSTLVAWLPEAEVSYNPLDFAAGRIVLFGFDLERPVINVVEHPSGRLNVEELLRLGGPDTGPHGPASLILFRNVRIADGTVTLRLQARHPEPGDSALEIASGGLNGRLRIRRFEHLNAQLGALQISSPRERGIRIDVTRLAVASRDPAVELVDVAGQLRVVGDSLALHLARVRLPASVLGATRGVVTWPRGTLLYDLRLHADSAALRDFPLIDRRFATAPGSGVVSGEVRVRSHGAALLEVELDPLHVAYRGGTLAGRLTAFAAPDSGLVALRDAALDAHAFDLEFARPFLDTLPFAGRLSGHTTAGGRLAALALSVDWAFRDSLVPGWPETRLRGQGEVNLRARDGIHFQPFTLAATSVDLGTVRRLVPAVRLHGTLSAVGTLSGPLRDAQFSGTLIQRDDGRPPSALAGKVRLDTRGEQLGIYADVTADSLSFDGLRGSFPDLPLHGAVAGPVRLAGPLAALDTHAELHGAGGTVQGDGVLLLDLPHYGARDFVLQAHELDLAHWAVGVPDSRLSFKATASFAGDSGVPPVGALSATLAPSLVKGTPLDSGRAVLRFADRRVYVDSLRIAQPGLISAGAGSLGWQHGTSGSLALDFAADSLGALDAWVGWVAGSAPGEAADGPGVAGSAHVLVTLQGSLDSVAVDARASGERLRWGGWNVTAGRGRLEWRPGPDASLALDATLDSLAHGAVGLAGVVASARGAPDSLAWFARSRVGGGAAFLAGGRFARGRDASRGAVARLGVDSLALQLPGDAWVLERPVTLAATDSAVTVSHLVLRSVYGTGQFVLEGDLPTRGRANAHLQLEAFPLAGAAPSPRPWASAARAAVRSRAGRSRSPTARWERFTRPSWTVPSIIRSAASAPGFTSGVRGSRSSPSRRCSRSTSPSFPGRSASSPIPWPCGRPPTASIWRCSRL